MQNELNNNLSQDTPYIILSYVLMLAYAIFGLGQIDIVHSKTVVGILGILTIICALILGLGISSVIGIPFNPLT